MPEGPFAKQAVCFLDAGTVAWYHGLKGPFETSVYQMWLRWIKLHPVALLSNPVICIWLLHENLRECLTNFIKEIIFHKSIKL